IQMVNTAGGSAFAVYRKSDGSPVAGPTLLGDLRTAGGPCAAGYGDGIVLFDPLASRWLMAEFAAVGNHLCVYVSRTSDPLAGGWFSYDFSTPEFPDYPKYAVWPDGYYVTSDESVPAVYALERARMLAGLSAACSASRRRRSTASASRRSRRATARRLRRRARPPSSSATATTSCTSPAAPNDDHVLRDAVHGGESERRSGVQGDGAVRRSA